MPPQFTSFTRPGAPVGTGQSDPLVSALLKQALSGAQSQRPNNNVGDLGNAALMAFLRGKARGTPSEPVAPGQADVVSGVELNPAGGFRTIGVAGNPGAARLLDLLPMLRGF